MTDQEALQLLDLLDKYVRLPDSDPNAGEMSLTDLAEDLWQSLDAGTEPQSLSTVVLPYSRR